MSEPAGPLREEERRSYAALFLFTVAILVVCTVWAIWQDTFSRHLWKSYKADFYRLAIAKYDDGLATDAERLAAIPEYAALATELDETRAALSSDGDANDRLAELASGMTEAKNHELETDLELRFVRGEIEEAWYLIASSEHSGRDSGEHRRRLAELEAAREQAAKDYAEAQDVVAGIQADIDEVSARVSEIEEAMGPYHRERDALLQKMEGVVFEVFGRRIPKIPTIDQVVLEAFEKNNFDQWIDRVDRCQNCHVAIDRAGFEDESNPFKTHPERKYYLGNHEVKSFGCTPCHGGQGPSVNSVEQAHGQVQFWEDPLFDIHDKVQTRCLSCHSSVQGMDGAGVAARGEWLFREMGCHGCHLVDGLEHLDKAGPSLRRIAAKANPEWLVDWIEAPHSFRPRTRMPEFFLERDEAEAVAAYLLSSSIDDSLQWLDAHPAGTGINAADEGLVGQGKELAESLGCLGCHGFTAEGYASQVATGKDTAPNLSRVAEKTNARWLYNWIQNPRSYSESARMPRLRLTDGEASAITSYLLTLSEQPAREHDAELRARLASDDTVARGQDLVRTYGCFGCHPITGMESESRIGVELNSMGSKHVEDLFFGDRLDVPHTWDDWVQTKILTPRTYQTDRIVQVMPEFGFDQADARALTVYLASRVEHKVNHNYHADNEGVPATLRRGRELVAYYNCQGCHSFDGRDGAIRKYYEDNIDDAPPILYGEGMKVQPEWLFDFIMKPVRLRPWLDVRMPSFGFDEDEANAIVAYLTALDGYDSSAIVLEASDDAGPGKRVHAAADAEGMDCYSCHPIGPGRATADNALVATTPLTPEQIAAWLAEHLGVESDQGSEDKSSALRDYLGG